MSLREVANDQKIGFHSWLVEFRTEWFSVHRFGTDEKVWQALEDAVIGYRRAFSRVAGLVKDLDNESSYLNGVMKKGDICHLSARKIARLGNEISEYQTEMGCRISEFQRLLFVLEMADEDQKIFWNLLKESCREI